MKRARTTLGLTLMELVLVMAVLATLMAIAAPRFSRFFAGRDMLEESRRVYALARYARTAAIERSARAEMWIDPESGGYGLDIEDVSGQNDTQPIEWKLKENLRFEIDPEQEFEENRVIVRFLPDGSLDEGAPERFGIRNEAGEGYDIRKRADGFGYDLGEVGDATETVQN